MDYVPVQQIVDRIFSIYLGRVKTRGWRFVRENAGEDSGEGRRRRRRRRRRLRHGGGASVHTRTHASHVKAALTRLSRAVHRESGVKNQPLVFPRSAERAASH